MTVKEQLAKELSLAQWQADATVALIEEGATIPFIARYRKEATGSLDDTVLRAFAERLAYLQNLAKRKREVCDSIAGQGSLTDELAAAVERAETLAQVEDIYRPYKPKRKTRASVARERGLEPLAAALLEQRHEMADPLVLAEEYVNDEKGVPDARAALAGAMDIVAEDVSDRADIRARLKEYLTRNAKVKTSGDAAAETVYGMYAAYEEPYEKLPGHRVLAINRGEREGVLNVRLAADTDACLGILYDAVLQKADSPARPWLVQALADSYGRLLFPSLENELRGTLTEKAQENAIAVFKENLSQLLMQPPLKNRVVLGLDPAYRTGCKIAVVDGTGKVLDTTVVYPTPPQGKIEEAKRVLAGLIRKHAVSVISIGNGTASGESERFVASLLGEMPEKVSYMVVSEAGASVYSASRLAAEEFPEFDVSLRSAVSIARRIQDPLAELVKIDPKAIGVGQYQHDMPPARLDASLGGVVEACVNSVGVDLNTASHSLLSYVAGINKTVAKNIVAYRDENGRFAGRGQLKKVKGLGAKAYEQCAGFLRVKNGPNALDNTAVHPESYKAAQELLAACGYGLADMDGGLADLRARTAKAGYKALADKLQIGEPTLRDIIDELLRPGRDPRDELPPPLLRTDVLSMEDLQQGMELSGTVRNIVDFGAFVDIGVHQDGLVHISQLSERYVRHPLDAVKLGQVVKVRVLSVDSAKKRIALSMKGLT